jgi:hypothetical protein
MPGGLTVEGDEGELGELGFLGRLGRPIAFADDAAGQQQQRIRVVIRG